MISTIACALSALASSAITTVAHDAFAIEAGKGMVVITTDPAGVDVYLDGEKLGASPMSRAVMPGDHLVEARSPNGTTSQIVKTIEGQSQVVRLVMTGAPKVPVPPTPPTTPAASTTPITDTTSPAPAPTADVAVMQLEGELPSPAHPHRRLNGQSASVGLACSSMSAPAAIEYVGPFSTQTFSNSSASATGGGCGFLLRLIPIDFFVGNTHVDLHFAGVGAFGLTAGLDLGSPFFQLGGPTSPFALAVRGKFDFVYKSVDMTESSPSASAATTTFTTTFLGGGLGVTTEGSLALTHALSIDFGLAGGALLGGLIATDIPGQRGPSQSTVRYPGSHGLAYGYFFNAFAGVRL